MESDQGFLYLLEGESLPSLQRINEMLRKHEYSPATQAPDQNSLFLQRDDCIISFQKTTIDDTQDCIGGAILPYISKRSGIDKLLTIAIPFALVFIISTLVWLASMAAVLLDGLHVLSMPVSIVDYFLKWMPLLTFVSGILCLIPSAPSFILPLAYRKRTKRIQTDLTNTVRRICDSLDLAEFKRRNIWQNIRVPEHVTRSIERVVDSMPSNRYKSLIQNLGRP